MPKTGYHACCKKAGCGKKAVARKVPKSNLIKGAKLTTAQKMVLLQRKKRREARNKKK